MADIYASPNSAKASRSSARAKRTCMKSKTGNIARVTRSLSTVDSDFLVAVNVIKRTWDPGAGEDL